MNIHSSLSNHQHNISYRQAIKADADSIEALVNSGYRGDASRAGWTTEADLLDGTRISAVEVAELIGVEGSVIYLCEIERELVGCVHLEKTEDTAYLGMFVVQPTLQGGGIGKLFMQAAEQLCQELWGTKKMWMTVISVRAELIAYYERRGYQRTGRFKPFGTGCETEILKVPNLEFEEMEKILSA